MKKFLLGFFSGAIIIFMTNSAYFTLNSNLAIDNQISPSMTNDAANCVKVIAYQPQETKPSEKIQIKKSVQDELSNNHQEQDKTAFLVEEITGFQKFVNAIPNAEIANYAPDTFKNEAVDNYWANDYQLTLDEYFRNEPELNDLIPQSIECKTSICKISFAITDNQEQNAASMRFLTTLKNNKNQIPVQVLFGKNPEALDIYIPRSNKGFFSKSIN